jgi:hypothetical protein
VNVELSTAISIGVAIFTAGGAWFTVRSTTQRLELQRERDESRAKEAMKDLESRLQDRLKEFTEKKDDQGRRIGAMEQRLALLEGRALGGESRAHRRSTAGLGIPITEDD